MKKLTPSRPLRLALEGDGPAVPNAVVVAVIFAEFPRCQVRENSSEGLSGGLPTTVAAFPESSPQPSPRRRASGRCTLTAPRLHQFLSAADRAQRSEIRHKPAGGVLELSRAADGWQKHPLDRTWDCDGNESTTT